MFPYPYTLELGGNLEPSDEILVLRQTFFYPSDTNQRRSRKTIRIQPLSKEDLI